MKLNFRFGLMMAAIFTLTNCAKENDAPIKDTEVVGIPFEIVAHTNDQTKTINDNKNTEWSVGDAINVWHAAAGSTEYNPAFTSFTVAEGDTEAGRFTGELNPETPLSETNDWYFFYPYNQYNKTPAGSAYENFSYQKIAQAHDGVQVQSGNDNMAHLVGTAFPLYGKVTSVASGDEVSTSMNQVVSVVKVTVTNNTSDPLTVNKVTFTSTQDIVGTFYVNFAGETLDFNSTGSGYVAKTATLNVENAEAILAEGSASFYLGVKPFTQSSGNLVVAVNSLEKTIPISSEVTFSSGKIKTINFNYNEVVVEPVEQSVTWNLAINETSSQSEELVEWDSNFVEMSLAKGSSSTKANNYLGGIGGNTVTRIYKDQVLTFTPKEYYAIDKIEITAPSSSYTDEFIASSWTNASATANSSMVTILPVKGKDDVSVAISAATRATSIKVSYISSSEYVDPTLESISASGYTTEFTQGDEFVFGGIVTAVYSNGSTPDVTASSSFSGYDLSKLGEQTVTITYEGETTTYNITVKEAEEVVGASLPLTEEFDNNTSADSSSAINSEKFSNFSGETSKAYTSKFGGLKLGSSSAIGYITTKKLDLSSPFTVKIDACKYGSDTGDIEVTVGVQVKVINNSELVTAESAESFKTFTLTFDAATSSSEVKIATTSKRAYIDNVIINYAN